MNIYNTLTRKIEKFTPNEEGIVRMYTCGPTVYHYAHIGNLRTYIFEDILEKGLEYLEYEVLRVMNVTDVGHLTSDGDTGEDKMEKGALREGKTVYEIAKFYTDAFFSDCNKLNIKKINRFVYLFFFKYNVFKTLTFLPILVINCFFTPSGNLFFTTFIFYLFLSFIIITHLLIFTIVFD